MRKAVAATTVGLLLVAGQAAAAGSNIAATRVGDRLGARTTAALQSEEGLGAMFGGIPAGVVIIGGVVLIAGISVLADSGDSD